MRYSCVVLVALSTPALADDEQPINIAPPPGLTPTQIDALPLPTPCRNMRAYAEPALFGGEHGAEYRHAFGLDAGGCDEVGLHLGARLDVGGLGGFLGVESELLFGPPAHRFGINATIESGTASRKTFGARLRLANVWLGVDVARISPRDDVSYRWDQPVTTWMFGIGLGGNAGAAFVKTEAMIALGTLRVASLFGGG